MNIELIAKTCHEVNRAYCIGTGDLSQLPWDQAPGWQKDSAMRGVQIAIDGATAEELHASWSAVKIADGWVYGEIKDADKKTHPCLVPYDQLPTEQKVKDYLFNAVVNSLKTEI